MPTEATTLHSQRELVLTLEFTISNCMQTARKCSLVGGLAIMPLKQVKLYSMQGTMVAQLNDPGSPAVVDVSTYAPGT